MATPVELKKDNVRKKGLVGFSWTTLFFGFFVPAFRGDLTWAVIMFFGGMFTFGITNIIFSFLYNKRYTEKLLQEGFEPANEEDAAALREAGLYV